MTTPKVLGLIGQEGALKWTGCELWRVLWPYHALQARGVWAQWAHHEAPDLADLTMGFKGLAHEPVLPTGFYRRVDAVISYRLAWALEDLAYPRQWADDLHRQGIAWWYDVDDDLFSEASLPQTRLIGQIYGHDAAQVERDRQARAACLAFYDGITVATQRVATGVRQYTDKPVLVVPNMIDLDWWHMILRQVPRPDKRLTIGWAGGRRLDRDAATMAQAWGRIARRFPDVQFQVAGYTEWPLLRDAVPSERLRCVPWQPAECYAAAYAGIDILCCPLAPTLFNSAKSAIKSFEAGALRAACVASPTVYGNVLRDGVTGYLAETTEDWEGALARLIEDSGHRRKLAARWAVEVERRYSLKANLWRWPAAWEQLLAHFRAERAVAV